MIGKQLNPGNINIRLGNLMMMEEEAIRVGDLDTASNLQDMQADYLSIYMKDGEWRDYELLPRLVYDEHLPQEKRQTTGQAHAALRSRRRYLLRIARRAGVFARAPELEVGDSSALDEEGVPA